MNTKEISLSVVDTDKPSQVRMFNSIGCEIGAWEYDEWAYDIGHGRIIVQAGDKFVMEGGE